MISHSSSTKSSILVNTSIVSFITTFTASAINIAIPAISSELNLSSVMAGWIGSSYLLVVAVFLLCVGKLSDIKGKKKLYLVGIVIFTVSSAASGLAFSGVMLIAARAVQGFGAAMLFACSMPILTSAYPPAERGRVLGISAACVYFGLSMGPFIGGIITQHLGWHAVFFFITAVMIPVFIMTLKTIPADKPRPDHPFDFSGALIYGACVTTGILGLSGIIGIGGKILLISGIALLILFLFHESREEYPLIPVREFRHNRTFIFSNLAAMIHYCATFSVSFFMSLYLQHVLGFNPGNAGGILMIQPIVQAAFSPLAGKLSDVKDPKILASSGIGITALVLGAIALYPGTLPVPFILTTLGILGLGLALFASPNNNAILGSAGHAHVGVASSVLGTMRVVGQSLSMAIAVLLLSHFIGTKQFGPESNPGFVSCFKAAFGISSILCIAGIFFSLMRGRHGK
jgi:EmrB/QacA subfamily drug resistance transporter